VVCAALAACGSSGSTTSSVATASPTPTSQQTASPSSSATPSWKTYTSTTMPNVSFQYPPNWTLKTNPGTSGASGTTVQEEDTTLTAPDGSSIEWQTNVSGIGGACPITASDPAVVVQSVTPIASAPGLGVVTVTGVGGAIVGYGVIPTSSGGKYGDTLTTGAQQQCGVYVSFTNPANQLAVFFNSGTFTSTSSGTPVPVADQSTIIAILNTLTVR
jgi:hypothetical protein